MVRRSIPLLCCVIQPWICQAASPTTLPKADESIVLPRQVNGAISSSTFLRRGYQSSAVLNGRVYIDGGEVSYYSGTDITFQYSNSLLSIDLSQDWTSDSVRFDSTSKPSGAANLAGGGLWVDETDGVLYTGFAGTKSNFGDNADQPQGLWSFKPDGTGGGTWQNLNNTADKTFTEQPRPYKGKTASGNGFGYFLGGYERFGTNASDLTEAPMSSLLTYDFASKKVTNETVNLASTQGSEQFGSMLYVPNFGKKGILVSVGGLIAKLQTDNNDEKRVSLDTARIFDIDSRAWFEQSTSGTPPAPRQEYCMAGVASDNQTYEILIYAGWGGHLGSASVPFDDAYVLTLPGFYWTKAPYTARNPRHSLSCNAVGGGQIITIGGVDTTREGPITLYKGVFTTTDPFPQGIAVFDLATLKITDTYKANRTSYSPASAIQSYYNDKGRKPESGFTNSQLESVFANQNFKATDNSDASLPPTPTNSSSPSPSGSKDPSSNTGSKSSSNAGAIAGGVVGGVAAIAAGIALGYFLARRRTKKKGLLENEEQQVQQQQQQQPQSPQGQQQQPQEPQQQQPQQVQEIKWQPGGYEPYPAGGGEAPYTDGRGYDAVGYQHPQAYELPPHHVVHEMPERRNVSEMP
ncbi:hypothetical protein NEUTE1DRAFT_76182 [Neurospora tetrasperma FGSC 2508]|uniref:Galactose oxidase n=1 Tax=Neurospora tetrasperma (strain FGSC 2508 / ATCC MYA-4615 / P0657) TaxID=510951 RepID=F8ME77_NEUT8|nr:uncharacterized protein NEUTE1DRAFT_76182 [Neurospora tetrasperma FGSC 2508]EGO60761.1 hypothetical protein NEUTE1DRAFT_76182 [Neurospora tetrasperma FGSC 2508]